MVRITYHRDKCIGCGYCVDIAPHRWVMNEKDGKATLAGGKGKHGMFMLTLNDEEYEENLEAAEVCPVNVIRVEMK